MNSLSLGFLYVVGYSWALCECCLVAGNGNWLPLIAYFALFIVTFSILGCLDVSDGFMNGFGSATAVILGFSLLAFAFSSFGTSPIVGLLKMLGAIAFVITGMLSLISGKTSEQHG